MSIALDFRPRTGWNRTFTDAEVASLTDLELSLKALPADLICVVNGTDISWFDEIPMLDFAAKLFAAVEALSASNRLEQFISTDLVPWWTVELQDDELVRISRQYLERVARCKVAELRLATARFGIRVYDTFVGTYPNVVDNGEFRDWYPLKRMKLESLSLE